MFPGHDSAPVHRDEAMPAHRAFPAPGFVKVVLRSRSPHRWGWELYRDGNDAAVERSEALFPYSEDAWKAGQVALGQLKPLLRPHPGEL
jgi:hypothetical protein